MIRQNFNADWTVEKGDGNSRMNSFLGNTQTKTVHLPYDAMIHEARTPDTKNGAQTGFYPGGEYIFQKHFTAPQAWQGKPVSLVFEGVYQTALVYLNGWLLTRNVNGYAEFTVEAGPYLKYGADNLLKVIADNSLEPNSRWYTGSGIYRPVRLLVGNKVYLPQDTVRITTREVGEGFALLDVTAQVQSASAVTERVTLQQTICREGTAVLTDRQNLLLQPGESRTVSFRYCVDSPALWSPENPKMCIRDRLTLEKIAEVIFYSQFGAAGHRTGARGAGALFCPSAAKHRCRHPGGVFPHHGGHREKSGRDLKGEWIKCTCCLRCLSPFLPAWVPALAPALPV